MKNVGKRILALAILVPAFGLNAAADDVDPVVPVVAQTKFGAFKTAVSNGFTRAYEASKSGASSVAGHVKALPATVKAHPYKTGLVVAATAGTVALLSNAKVRNKLKEAKNWTVNKLSTPRAKKALKIAAGLTGAGVLAWLGYKYCPAKVSKLFKRNAGPRRPFGGVPVLPNAGQ